jgi:hypothetical protein
MNASKRRLLVLAVLWAVVTGAMLIVPGCYGENCNGSAGNYGVKPGEGRMIDENTWESTPIDGKWLHFSSGHIWFFDVPALGDRIPYHITTYISPIEEPNTFGPDKPVGNFTVAGGNLAELSGVGPNRFVVRNGTCAEYFMRVVAEVAPRPGTVAPGNAGEVDAGVVAGDAGFDASVGDSGPSDAATDAETGP